VASPLAAKIICLPAPMPAAAAIYALIESAKLNRLNPQHYLADVLARIADHPARRIAELLPWNWQPVDTTRAAA
jgi:transposase